jgi:hypothetical protein
LQKGLTQNRQGVKESHSLNFRHAQGAAGWRAKILIAGVS